MAKSFREAFAAARKAKGPGATFTWNGKSYSTNTADDAKSSRPKARSKTAPTVSKRPTTRTSPKSAPSAAKRSGGRKVTTNDGLAPVSMKRAGRRLGGFVDAVKKRTSRPTTGSGGRRRR